MNIVFTSVIVIAISKKFTYQEAVCDLKWLRKAHLKKSDWVPINGCPEQFRKINWKPNQTGHNKIINVEKEEINGQWRNKWKQNSFRRNTKICITINREI